jgi:hypothetical protein
MLCALHPSQSRLAERATILYAFKIQGERHDQGTKNGRPEAVVMGADEFESWLETLELLSNPKAVKFLKQGFKEAKTWKRHSFEDVFGGEQ